MNSLHKSLKIQDAGLEIVRRAFPLQRRLALALVVWEPLLGWLQSHWFGVPTAWSGRLILSLCALALALGSLRMPQIRAKWSALWLAFAIGYLGFQLTLAWIGGLSALSLAYPAIALIGFGLLCPKPLALWALLSASALQMALGWAIFARPDGTDPGIWLVVWAALLLGLAAVDALRAHRRRENQLASILHQGLFEGSPLACLLVDPSSEEILLVNSSARKMLAIPVAPAAPALRLASFLDQTEQGREQWTSDITDKGWTFEATLRACDGRCFPARLVFSQIKLDRGRFSVVQIQSLARERERTEQLEQQRRELEEYGSSLEELQALNRLKFKDDAEHYRTCLTTGCRRLDMEAALLVLWGENASEQRILSRIATFGDGTLPGSPDPDLLEQLYSLRDMLSIEDLASDTRARDLELPLEAGSLLSLPLMLAGNQRGMVIFRSLRARPRPFSSLELTFATLLAQALARSVEIQLTREQRNAVLTEQERFFTLSSAMLCILDEHGTLLQVNPEWTRLLGYPRESLLGRPVTDLLDPAKVHAIMETYDAMMQRGGDLSVQVWFRAMSGDWKSVQWSAWFDADTRLVYAAGVDNTRQLEVESQLRDSEGLLTEFVLHLPAAVAMFDPEMRYLMTSQRWLNEYRLENSEWIGRSHLDLFPTLARDLRSKLSTVLAGGRVTANEVLLRHTDGSEDWIRTELRPWHRSDGAVGGVLMFSEVITEARRAHDELLHAHDDLRSLLDALPDLYFKLDADGIFLDSHTPDSAELIAAPELSIGKHFAEVLPPEIASVTQEAIHALRSGDESFNREYQLELPGGVQHFEARYRQLLGGQFLVLVQNITQRVQHEEQLRTSRDAAHEALQAKSDFLAMMSHEIRTPMNGVIGVTNLLMETHLDGEQLDYVNTIQQSGDTLLTVINDILDFSKIEAGKVRLESLDMDLRELVDDSIELFSARAREKQLELLTHFAPDCPARLKGDPVRLRQVLFNLLGNALKFTEKGFVRVELDGRELGDGVTELQVSVIDSGIGISPEAARRLFNPFSQADGSTTRKYGGTGLGLSICRKLVELMNGRIGVDSEPEVGSRFHFSARLLHSDDRRTFGDIINPTLLEGKRILVLGDAENTRRSLVECLTAWGAELESELLEETQPLWLPSRETADLVLLLRHRGIPDGRDKLAFIQTFRQPDHPEVILLSSGERSSLYEAEQFNLFHKVLVRPARQRELLNAILSALGMERRAIPDREKVGSGLDAGLGERLGLKVLLVEDNRVNQKLALRMLGKMGFQPELAENGLEAFEAVQARTVDLVLMDMQMPVMDGLQATRLIRAELSAAQQPVIIAMTANAMDEDRQACLAAGMNDFITKPISIQVVQEKLRLWFDSQQAHVH